MKFGPKEIKELNEYLRTGRNRKREFLGGGITFASDLTQPIPKKEIVEIDAINAFMKRNPRADGGRIELSSGGKPVSTKSIGGGVYEVTYKGGTKTYYGKYTRDKKTFKKSFGTDKEAAANFVIEGQKAPPAKSVVELQKGATTLETPKYKQALSDALDEVSLLEQKGYGDVDGIVKKYQNLFTEEVGTKTRTGKTIKKGTGNRAYKAITFAIREHANRLNIQSIKNVNAINALDAYQKLKSPQRGDLTRIAKEYNVPSGTFERYLTNLNIRKKIPLQFGSDAEYKKYLAQLRSDAIDEFSSKRFEKFLQGVPKIQKSHMGDLYNQFVTTGNIGFAPQVINAEALKTIDANIKAINEEVKLLFKNKPEGYVKKIDALNQLGDNFAAASQGYKKYQGINPYTGEDLKRVISFSKPSQELDPTDLFVDEKGQPKKLSELTDQDKALLEVLKKQSMKSAKLPKKEIIPMKEKILDATGKVLKGAGKVLKPLGYAIGTNAVIQAKSIADEMGIELKPQDYFMALDSGDANIAINNYKRRNDPKFAAAERAKDLAQMSDDFEEVGQPMNIDLTMPKFATGGRIGFMAGTIPGGYSKQANRYLKEIESDMHRGYQYYKRSGGKKKFQDYVKESMRKYFAGGGISKLAGVDSGPPPERGPNPQGLPGLLKRVKNL